MEKIKGREAEGMGRQAGKRAKGQTGKRIKGQTGEGAKGQTGGGAKGQAGEGAKGQAGEGAKGQAGEKIKGWGAKRINRLKQGGAYPVMLLALAFFFLFLLFAPLWKLSDAEQCFQGLRQIRLENNPLAQEAADRILQGRDQKEEAAVGGGGSGTVGAGDDAPGTVGAGDEGAAQKPPLYTFWTQKGGVRLENKDLGRSAEGDVIYYFGDNSLPFNLIQDTGCALSQDVAASLWGTAREGDVIGSEVMIGGQSFVVERVLAADSWQGKWAGGAAIAKWRPVDSMALEGEAKGRAGSQNESAVEKWELPGGMRFDVLDIRLDAAWAQRPGRASAVVREAVRQGNLKDGLEIDYDWLMGLTEALAAMPAWAAAFVVACLLFTEGRRGMKGLGRLFAAWRNRDSYLVPPDEDAVGETAGRRTTAGETPNEKTEPGTAAGAQDEQTGVSAVVGIPDDEMLTEKIGAEGAAQWIKEGKRAACLLGAAAALALTYFFLGPPILLPDSFMPSRWSDFSFWGKTARGAAQAQNAFFSMKLYGPDMYIRQTLLFSMLASVGRTIIVLAAAWGMKKRLGKRGFSKKEAAAEK